MKAKPGRGRVVIVDFERSGAPIWPEMNGKRRPCIVLQNDGMKRARLVTVVPLSTTAPEPRGREHHRLDCRWFRNWPGGGGREEAECWAKCDCVTTVSLDRCTDPILLERGFRRYLKVSVTSADLDAVERAVLFSLGIVVASKVESNDISP